MPAFLDRFHDVWQMIDAFNEHYECEYVPSWLNCLEESMNSFLEKFCPGFMCVPRKPHPFGNEYHSIDDGVTEKGLEEKPIMWRVKLQEGKDRLKKPDGIWALPSEFPGYSKTATLMLEMTKPVHHTGKIVAMDKERFSVENLPKSFGTTKLLIGEVRIYSVTGNILWPVPLLLY